MPVTLKDKLRHSGKLSFIEDIDKERSKRTYNTAIVGVGPKGLYTLERTIAALSKKDLHNKPVVIHIFEPEGQFGRGTLAYTNEQGDFTLANSTVQELNMWTNAQDVSNGVKAYKFSDWLKFVKRKEMSLHAFPPRKLIGEYLSYGFKQIIDNLPPNITVKKYASKVNDIRIINNKVHLKHELNPQQNIIVDTAALCTGHSISHYIENSYEDKLYQNGKHKNYMPYIYPLNTKLAENAIPKNTKVATIGMHLTFLDTALSLTEGRGGKFVNGKYISSGREPKKIIATSRSNSLILPKNFGPELRTPASIFTPDNLERIKKKSKEKLNFLKDIWPLWLSEMRLEYYSKHIEIKNPDKLQQFRNAFINAYQNPKEQLNIIDSFTKELNIKQFSFKDIVSPFKDQIFSSKEAYQEAYLSFIKHHIKEAKKGTTGSPERRAIQVFSDHRKMVEKLIKEGALTKEGETEYKTRLTAAKRIFDGAASQNIEKIVMLCEAGIVDIASGQGAYIQRNNRHHNFSINEKVFQESYIEQDVDFVIDARVRTPDITRDLSPLWSKMIAEGRACSDQIENKLKPGCVKISDEHFLIDKNNKKNPQIMVAGAMFKGRQSGVTNLSTDRNKAHIIIADNIAKDYTISCFVNQSNQTVAKAA